MRSTRNLCVAVLFLFAASLAAQTAGTRMVHGTVRNGEGQPVAGAVVKIEDSATLQVRSYITDRDGTYLFTDLSTNADYQIRAKGKDGGTASDTLSRFDSRKDAVVNLKLRK